MSNFSVNVQVEPPFLHIAVSGDNAVETVLRYLSEMYAACVRFECPYVLLEENLSGPSLSIEQVHGIVSSGSKHAWPVVQVVACVDLNAEHIESRMKMTETIAENNGLKIKWLATVDAAEKWLRERIAASTEK